MQTAERTVDSRTETRSWTGYALDADCKIIEHLTLQIETPAQIRSQATQFNQHDAEWAVATSPECRTVFIYKLIAFPGCITMVDMATIRTAGLRDFDAIARVAAAIIEN